jgi:hypothetical protein
LIARGRPIEIRVYGHELARYAKLERLEPCAGRAGDTRVRRVVRRVAVDIHEERRLVLDQTTADVKPVLLILLFALGRRERVARAHGTVAQAIPDARANGPDTRLGDHLNEERISAVILGGELVASYADRFDLRFGWQPTALEAVDAHDGARPCHVHQLALHFVWVVG